LLELPEGHLAVNLIQRMLRADPRQRPRIAQICHDISNFDVKLTRLPRYQLIGEGGEGQVYRSFYQMKPVAIKRLELSKITNGTGSKRDERLMLQLDHVNVLKLFHWEDRGIFRYRYKL
jgi:hypothetical protein